MTDSDDEIHREDISEVNRDTEVIVSDELDEEVTSNDTSNDDVESNDNDHVDVTVSTTDIENNLNSDLIEMFLSFTGTEDRDLAISYLETSHGDIELAAERYLTGIPPQAIILQSQSQETENPIQSSSNLNSSVSMAQNLSVELEQLMRNAGEDEVGINRLYELTNRFLNISRTGGEETSRRRENLELFPTDENKYLIFDDLNRITDVIVNIQRKKLFSKLYEIGNYILYSKKTCERLIHLNVIDEIILKPFEDRKDKYYQKYCIRSLQLIEALVRSIILNTFKAKQYCKRWFVTPRRTTNSASQQISFLNGLVVISPQGQTNSSSRTYFTQQFIEKVLPTSDVRKLEHMWLNDKLDTNWRDKETESELLSVCLKKGCSIKFLIRLVDLVRGCRACVNPLPERVGKLQLPLILAAKATGVNEKTDISSDEYGETDDELDVAAIRELWSHRACEILLDYGASVKGIKVDDSFTYSAKSLISAEKKGIRTSTRLEALQKIDSSVSSRIRKQFIDSLLPNLFVKLIDDLKHTTKVVFSRGLDTINTSITILKLSTSIEDRTNFFTKSEVTKAIISLAGGSFETETLSNENILIIKLLICILAPNEFFTDEFKFKKESLNISINNFDFISEEYQKIFALKLKRFGILKSLQHFQTKTIESSSKEEVSFIIELLKFHLDKGGWKTSSHHPKTSKLKQLLIERSKDGLTLLHDLLQVDIYSSETVGFEGITSHEFIEAEMCTPIAQYLAKLDKKGAEEFFQIFQPPLVGNGKESEDNTLSETLVEPERNVSTELDTELITEEEEEEKEDLPALKLNGQEIENNTESPLYKLMFLIQCSLSNKSKKVVSAFTPKSSSIKELIKPFVLKLTEKNMNSSFEVCLLPITPLKELKYQILRTCRIQSEVYSKYCNELVGHRISIRSKYLEEGSFDEADVIGYDLETGAHFVTILLENTTCSAWLNLLLFDVIIIKRIKERDINCDSKKKEAQIVKCKESKFCAGDEAFIWFSGKDSFKHLCASENSNFSTDPESIFKISNYDKPGWYSVDIREVNEVDGEINYSVQYTQVSFEKDRVIRKGETVFLKKETRKLEKFKEFDETKSGKVVFIADGLLITDEFNAEILHASQVEKRKGPVNKQEAPIFEKDVCENRLKTIDEMYIENEKNCFAVHLVPKLRTSEDISGKQESFHMNQRIKSRWGARSRYYFGYIARKNLDGTYDIMYDDGDTERQVSADLIISDNVKPMTPTYQTPSFSKLFPTAARKLLFEVLKEPDSVLTHQKKYNFMTRGFKHQPNFESCFTNSMKKVKSGVFAKCQTYQQAYELYKKLKQLSSSDLDVKFEVKPMILLEKEFNTDPAVLEEIKVAFTKQSKTKHAGLKSYLINKLKRCRMEDPHPKAFTKYQRVQVAVSLDTEDKDKDEVMWLPATIIKIEEESGTVQLILDNGTLLNDSRLNEIRSENDSRAKISFVSIEREKPSSPTKQIASPIGVKRRKQRNSTVNNMVASSMRFGPTTSGFNVEELAQSDSNVDFVMSAGGMEQEDDLERFMRTEEVAEEDDVKLPKAKNEPGTTVLTRRFAAFGESFSYKHISSSSIKPDGGEPIKILKSGQNTDLSVPSVEINFFKKNPQTKDLQNIENISSTEEALFFSIDVSKNLVEKAVVKDENALLKLVAHEVSIFQWLKDHLFSESLAASDSYETSLPWKNQTLNDALSTIFLDNVTVATNQTPKWPKIISQSYGFLLEASLREKLIFCGDLGASRAVSYLQDETPGYLQKKKKLVQNTLELSTFFTSANPDILKYEQLQAQCDRVDEEIKKIENENFIGKLNEDLVKVSRDSIIQDSKVILSQHKKSRSRMIVQFLNENSSGDGVTTDFYTSIAVELQKKEVNEHTPLFVDSRSSSTPENEIGLSTSGLFLQPLSPCAFAVKNSEEYSKAFERNERVLNMCSFLGELFAKAFLDGHRIPLPLAPDFFQIIKEQHMSNNFSYNESAIDVIEGYETLETGKEKSGFIRTLRDLVQNNKTQELQQLLENLSLTYIDISQPFFKGQANESATDKILESKEEEKGVDFPLTSSKQEDLNEFATAASKGGCSQKQLENKMAQVGATKTQIWKALHLSQNIRNNLVLAKTIETVPLHIKSAEFCEGSSATEITVSNVEEYLEKLYSWWLHDGIKKQVVAFIEGMEQVLGKAAVNSLLTSFSSSELKRLLCGREEIVWDESDELLGFIVPCAEYKADSKPIKLLVEVLRGMSMRERSKFLNFATAQPRMPISGMPKIKVYPPLLERTLGVQLSFAVSVLTSKAELTKLEAAVQPFVPTMFKKGDLFLIKSAHNTDSGIVQSWEPSTKTLYFEGNSKSFYQVGQLVKLESNIMSILRAHKAEVAIKKVLGAAAVVQCKPYLRPKATTCAKTIYLPKEYQDKEHMLTIFKEAFEDARLGGIHD